MFLLYSLCSASTNHVLPFFLTLDVIPFLFQFQREPPFPTFSRVSFPLESVFTVHKNFSFLQEESTIWLTTFMLEDDSFLGCFGSPGKCWTSLSADYTPILHSSLYCNIKGRQMPPVTTEWHGSVGMVGMGWWLDLILTVFSSLCDSKHTALNDHVWLCPFDMLCKAKHLPEKRSDCRPLQITAPYWYPWVKSHCGTWATVSMCIFPDCMWHCPLSEHWANEGQQVW